MSKKKSKKLDEKPTAGCKFEIKREEFLGALTRVHELMKVDSVPVTEQILVVTAEQATCQIVFESGCEGAYVRVTVPAIRVHRGGYLVTNIAVPWLKFRSDEIEFDYSADSGSVFYRSGAMKGTFVTMGTQKQVVRNLPDKPPSMVEVEKKALHDALSTVLFNADTIDDNPDVLVEVGVIELEKKKVKDPIKRKGKNPQQLTHQIEAVVFDRHRSAFCRLPCDSKQGFEPKVFGSSHIWTFITKMNSEEKVIRMGLDEDTVWLESDSCLSVTPVISSNVQAEQIRTILTEQFPDSSINFSFEINTSALLDSAQSVLSVRGGPMKKLSAGKDPNEARLVIKSKGGLLSLNVKGETGTASTRLKLKGKHSGEGSVTVDGTFLVEAISLVDPSTVVFSFWKKIVRVDVPSHHYTRNFFSTMKER